MDDMLTKYPLREIKDMDMVITLLIYTLLFTDLIGITLLIYTLFFTDLIGITLLIYTLLFIDLIGITLLMKALYLTNFFIVVFMLYTNFIICIMSFFA